MQSANRKFIFGWIAVSISAIFSNLWSYWGIIENFHEGWYHVNIWDNIQMMFGQYLLVPLAFILLGFISVNWNRFGAMLHIALAVFAFTQFGNMNAGILFIAIPLILLASLYWFGNITKKLIAYIPLLFLPLLMIITIGSVQFYKVSHRYNDHNLESRIIKGNRVELIWAPEGPGWADNGTTWDEANKICSLLSEDGKSISKDVKNIWRLPTVEEAVASQVYHGENAGGIWNSQKKEATYSHQPDKESPLWNPNVKTIYWWTATEVNDKQAYIIIYNGAVHPRNKNIKAGYLNFRAVKKIGK